jgi:hypothetical protein
LKERQKQREQLEHQAGSSQSQVTADSPSADDLPTVPFEEEESLPPTLPTQHHHISMDKRQKIQVPQWLHRNQADPALKVRHPLYCLSLEKLTLLLGFLTTAQEPPLIAVAWIRV